MSDPKLELIEKTAELARLELTAEEAAQLAPQFDAILAHFDILASIDVEGVPPTRGATDLADVKREDNPRESGPHDRLLDNAPDREGEHYGVPKTIGDEA